MFTWRMPNLPNPHPRRLPFLVDGDGCLHHAKIADLGTDPHGAGRGPCWNPYCDADHSVRFEDAVWLDKPNGAVCEACEAIRNAELPEDGGTAHSPRECFVCERLWVGLGLLSPP